MMDKNKTPDKELKAMMDVNTDCIVFQDLGMITDIHVNILIGLYNVRMAGWEHKV